MGMVGMGMDGRLSGSPLGDGMEIGPMSASPIPEMTFGRNACGDQSN